MDLYKKYRPDNLKNFFGNRITIEALESVLAEREKIPHAILFTGPSGCGKTTLGRLVKNTLECHDLDYTEMDAAGFEGGVETIREIRRRMVLRPAAGKTRVWLLDECHMIGEGGDSPKNKAQNALLKALEEAPAHVYFILCTTDPQRLLKTIKSRCMEFRVQSLSERQMTQLLNFVLKAEDKIGNVTEDALSLISKNSLGSPRTALNLLQKVIDLDKRQQTKAVEEAETQDTQIIDLCRNLLKRAKWSVIRPILQGLQDQEAETVRRKVLGYCNAVLLNENDVFAAAIIREFRYNTYDSGWSQLVESCYSLTIQDIK